MGLVRALPEYTKSSARCKGGEPREYSSVDGGHTTPWFAARSRSPAVLVTVIASTTAKAAVVSPPSFDALVATAGDIFLGQVTGRASRVEIRGAKRLIVTDVTFRVDEVVKGEPRRLATLTFLGGSVGDVRMDAGPGMPTFMVGDRDVVFVRSGRPTLMPWRSASRSRMSTATISAAC